MITVKSYLKTFTGCQNGYSRVFPDCPIPSYWLFLWDQENIRGNYTMGVNCGAKEVAITNIFMQIHMLQCHGKYI